MTEELFRDYWWLIFPIFGMGMGLWGMVYSERRAKNVIDLVRTYTDQGKEPPPELLRLAAKSLEEDGSESKQSPAQSNAWSFFTFGGLAAGFSVAYAFTSRTEDWAWVFLAVAVGMAVMALGALVMLLSFRKR